MDRNVNAVAVDRLIRHTVRNVRAYMQRVIGVIAGGNGGLSYRVITVKLNHT